MPKRVMISSLPFRQLMEQTSRLAQQEQPDEAKFSRPELDNDYLAPRDDIEQGLASIWQELLGVDQIGIRDSFFELGGHSLIAVRLFARIRQTYHVSYPISVLFEAPTIEGCATLIRENAQGDSKEKRPQFTHLVPMHMGTGGDRTPFFLVAGMFGNVLNLRHLAHLIGTDRPFFGLQARGLYGDDEPHENFVDMAGDYLREMRVVQPHGPYLIGGFSGGGITAYEMAQQLIAAGEQVAMLVLIDTPLPHRPSLSREDKLRFHLGRLKEQGFAYPLHWLRDRLSWELHRFRNQPTQPDPLPEAAFHSLHIEQAFRQALADYQVHPYAENVFLFRPGLEQHYQVGPDRFINKDRDYVYPDNGWGSFTPSLAVFEVPGDHDSMVLEPNVRVLAARLRELIEAVEA